MTEVKVETVEEAISESFQIDPEFKKALMGEAFGTTEGGESIFVAVDTNYPQMLTDAGEKLPSDIIKRRHSDYLDNQKLVMLTRSLFSGGGRTVPSGSVINEETATRILRKLKYRVKRVKELYRIEDIRIPGAILTLEDTTRWVVVVRALHWIGTRHDPDLDEYIVRRLANQIGRTESTPISL